MSSRGIRPLERMRPGKGHARRLAARLGLLCLLIVAAAFAVRCTRELDPSRGDGDVALTWKAGADARIETADSIRVTVLDGRDQVLAGPVVAPFDTSRTSFDLSLRVSAGDNRAVRVQLEGAGSRGRGVLAAGEVHGLTVPAAGTAEANVRLAGVVPRMKPFQGQPGDLRITVAWSAVPGALGYRLYRRPSTGAELVEDVPDTVRIFDLVQLVRDGSARRSGPRPAPLDPAVLDTTWFRVSAILHGGLTSVASDSLAVSFGWIEDTPHVLSTFPLPDAAGVPDSVAIEIEFDRPMNPSTLGNVADPGAGSAVLLSPEGGGSYVGFLADPESWRDGGRRLHLQPAALLQRGARYLLRVTPELRDLDGRPLDQFRAEAGLQEFTLRFGTESYDPLRVVAVTPADGATGVELRPHLEARLNRRARPGTVNAETVVLADSAGALVPCTVALVQDSLIDVVPVPPLRFATLYRLTVTTDVRDLRGRAGEPLDQTPLTPFPDPFMASFRTLAQPRGPSVIDVAPLDGARSVPPSTIVRVRFSRPIVVASTAGNITVRRLPVGAAIAGVLAPSSPDRTEFTFTPSLLERGVTYRVVVDPGGLDGEGNPVGIRDDNGIPFDQDSLTAGYQEFSSRFRVESSPRVLAVAPAAGRQRVPVDTLVAVQFSLPMDRNSVTAENLAILADATPVPLLALQWNTDSTLVRLRPVLALSYLRTFTVRADTSLRSTRGSRFDQDPDVADYQPFLSEFTTAPDGIPPRVESWLPGEGATGVHAGSPVSVRFTKAVVPATVLREEDFYLRKLPSGPTVAASRTMTSDSVTATLVPNAPLDQGAAYQVTVTKFVEDRFGQQLDQDPAAPFNQDFTGTFRIEIELVPPRVAAVTPDSAAVDVAIDTPVEITFSEPMTADGLTAKFALSGPDGAVDAGVVLSPDLTHLICTPILPLRYAVRYDVRVDTTATDLAGNLLDQYPGGGRDPFRSFFTTRPDLVPPRVSASAPAPGDTAVGVTVHPSVTFDETMNAASVPGALRLVDPQGAAVPLSAVEVDPDGRSAVLIPADSLAFSTDYTLEAGDAARDTSGNGLDQDPATPGAQPYLATFRTRTENIPPRVSGLRFDEGPPVPADSPVRVVFTEPIDPVTVTDQTVRLTLAGSTVGTTVTPLAPDTALVVPLAPLVHDTTYTLTVEAVVDLHGNVLDQDPQELGAQPYVTTFRTGPDLAPPRVVHVFPPADSAGVDPRIAVEIRFDKSMDPATVAIPDFALYDADGGDLLVDGTITASPGDLAFQFHPTVPLAPGGLYRVHVGGNVADRHGNLLDQDPATPSREPFASSFEVGVPPVISIGEGICDPADSSRVDLTLTVGTGVTDSLASAEIDWGDGSVEPVAPSGPPWPVLTHYYACTDARGCNLIDDDGDGGVDEAGPSGCDESYRIIMRALSTRGLWAADTSGVAFCNLQFLSSSPADHAAGVDTLLASISVRASRRLDTATLTTSRLLLARTAGGAPIEVAISSSADGLTVYLQPSGALQPGTEYRVRALAGIKSDDGRAFDQDPCVNGRQEFTTTFTTVPRPAPVR